MAVKKSKRRQAYPGTESDSVYFLKVVLFFILGSIWLDLHTEWLPGVTSLPLGLVIGVVFASHDHFMIDRKIEYVVLLGAALLSYLAPIGLVLQA